MQKHTAEKSDVSMIYIRQTTTPNVLAIVELYIKKKMLFQTIQWGGAFRLIFKKLSSTKKHSNFTDAVLK